WERSFDGVRASVDEPLWLWLGGVMSVLIVLSIKIGTPRIGGGRAVPNGTVARGGGERFHCPFDHDRDAANRRGGDDRNRDRWEPRDGRAHRSVRAARTGRGRADLAACARARAPRRRGRALAGPLTGPGPVKVPGRNCADLGAEVVRAASMRLSSSS